MTDLPYTYTDSDRARLVVSRTGRIEVTEVDDADSDVVQAHAIVSIPTGEDAVRLARAVLAAAGDTGHEVVSSARMAEMEAEIRQLLQQRSDLREEVRPRGLCGDLNPTDPALPECELRAGHEMPHVGDSNQWEDDEEDTSHPDEIGVVEDFDAGWAAGYAHASADADRITALEAKVADLGSYREITSRRVDRLATDLSQAQAAVRGVGEALRDHVTATVDAIKAAEESGIAGQLGSALEKVRADFKSRRFPEREDG